MLPTHGAATATFLLAHANRTRVHADRASWVQSARARTSYLAGALDLEACAVELERLRLADIAGEVTLRADLASLSSTADRVTLVTIAGILLRTDPPPWLQQAVHGQHVRREYIPARDLAGLAWLDAMLDPLLLAAADSELLRGRSSGLREGLGLAGELVVLGALRSQGLQALHVALISDTFGYDLEVQGADVRCLEVKSTTESRADTFHLSRHEYDTARRLRHRWELVQVVFAPEVLTATVVNRTHVRSIKTLAPLALEEAVPADSDAFRWTESAVLTLPESAWLDTPLADSAASLTQGVVQLSRVRSGTS